MKKTIVLVALMFVLGTVGAAHADTAVQAKEASASVPTLAVVSNAKALSVNEQKAVDGQWGAYIRFSPHGRVYHFWFFPASWSNNTY